MEKTVIGVNKKQQEIYEKLKGNVRNSMINLVYG